MESGGKQRQWWVLQKLKVIPPEGRDMYCLLELFSGLPSFLASALSHEHGDARGNLALSRSHTGVFGCHLVYVFLNSRATCLAASSGPSDDRRMRCGGGGGGKG